MTDKDYIMYRLKRIAEKHRAYFNQEGYTIYDCLEIKVDDVISVQIIKPNLPSDIQFEIETACWLE